MKTPIIGGQYISRSLNAADNRLINLYPELISEGGKEPGLLVRCPGLTRKLSVGLGPIRGMLRVNNIAYIVSGKELYRITENYTSELIGNIPGLDLVSMAHNGTQIFIACNPKGFVFNISTNTLVEVTDDDFPGAVTVDFLDGYFVFNQPNSQLIWVTGLLDGTDIDSLDFTSAEGNPDNVVAIKVDHREVWIFGNNSVEVFYNSGMTDFPLTRIQGAFLEIGCSAPHSIAKLDNSLYWLGSDDRGSGMIYKSIGYSGRRVSNHSIEDIIQNFTTITDATAYSYQQSGHSFYVLTFPTEGRTFVYDIATESWHERASFINGSFTRHRSNCQMVFNNKVHVGDFEVGNIYIFDSTNYTDNGTKQKWLRSWRALMPGKNNLKRVIHHQLQLDCETGVGLEADWLDINDSNIYLPMVSDLVMLPDLIMDGHSIKVYKIGEDALIMLRWSDDGGKTWSKEHWRSLGRLGKTLHRVIWNRLGASRDRIYELSGTDPNKVILLGAELKLTEAST